MSYFKTSDPCRKCGYFDFDGYELEALGSNIDSQKQDSSAFKSFP